MPFAFRFVLKDWEQELLAYRAAAEGTSMQRALVNTLVETAEDPTKVGKAAELVRRWTALK